MNTGTADTSFFWFIAVLPPGFAFGVLGSIGEERGGFQPPKRRAKNALSQPLKSQTLPEN
jgi:hypothetical protein